MSFVLRSFPVYFFAGLFSIFLSYYASCHIDVINPDGICYLKSAEAMSQGLHYAMQLCPQSKWAFYSALIFSLAKVTHLGFVDSAYLLNGFLSLISVLSFMAIIQSINSHTRLLWLAAFVILLGHEFNVLRQDVIRDHGFLAFYLLSTWLLIRYFRVPQWRFALGWAMSLMIATLFRIEAAVFLSLLPCLTWVDRRLTFSARLKAFFQLHLLAMLLIVLLISWLLYHPSQDLNRLSELQYQLLHSWQNVVQNFSERIASLTKYVLPSDSTRDVWVIFILTFLSWYIVQVIVVLSLIYSLLVVYAWRKGLLVTQGNVRLVLWGYIVVSILITVVFLAEHFFLSKRYLMALSLILMIWVPFSLDHLIRQGQKRKWLVGIIFLLLVLSSLGGIFRFGYSKNYIHQAGNWLAVHVPQNATIYANDYQLMYYSNHFGDDLFQKVGEYSNFETIKNGLYRQYDYLALRDKNNHDENNWAQHDAHLSPLIVFSNSRGDQVIIYKIPH